jgi:protein-S-isoprenylcysteine O-methyltransferase Ste14
MHVPVPWVFVLTYLLGMGLERLWRGNAHPSGAGAVAGVGGAVLLATGAAIAGWSLVIFHRARTTTVPGRTSARLVTWGPYRISRNPMYVGLVLAYLGEAGILGQVGPVLLLPLTVAYLDRIVIPIEEARLSAVFEREYQAYRASVRRWI